RLAWRGGRWRLITAFGIHPVLTSGLGQHTKVLNAGVVLHDRACIHDVTAVPSHFFQDAAAEPAHFLRLAEAQQHIRNSPANREMVMQFAMHMKNIILIAMENDAAPGQLAKRIEVMLPFTLGIEESLMAVLPELLDDRFKGRPIMRGELFGVNEGHATAMHP